MTFSSLFLCTLLVATPFAAAHTKVYTAELEPFGDNSQVTGKAVVFTAHGGTLAYSGSAADLAQAGTDSACADVNGCGAYIRTGTSCFNTTTLGDLYYEDPVLSDPWTNERYSTSESTSNGFYDGDFQGLIEVGATSIEGLVFVLHGEDGSPVACGLLQPTDEGVLTTDTEPMGDSLVTSEITTISGVTEAGEVCFFGKAYGLQSELVSFKADPVGTDCTADNGCGLHVYSGTSCTDSTTQGENFYSTADDPWTTIGYLTTDADGYALFFDCVSTGETDMEGKAFVVHADDGSRVSCGLLLSAPEETYSPTEAPASSVGKFTPIASVLAMLTTAVIAVTL